MRVTGLKAIQSITKDAFLNYLSNRGDYFHFIPMPYSQVTKKKCKIFSMWAAARLIELDLSFFSKLYIHKGLVRGQLHTWIELDGFYIDGTLAQFYPDMDGIIILPEAEAGEIYFSLEKNLYMEWAKNQKRAS